MPPVFYTDPEGGGRFEWPAAPGENIFATAYYVLVVLGYDCEVVLEDYGLHDEVIASYSLHGEELRQLLRLFGYDVPPPDYDEDASDV